MRRVLGESNISSNVQTIIAYRLSDIMCNFELDIILFFNHVLKQKQ